VTCRQACAATNAASCTHLLQYLAVRHPEQVLLLPLTSCSSEGPDSMPQTGLLQQRLCAMALQDFPTRHNCCTRPPRIDSLLDCSPAALPSIAMYVYRHSCMHLTALLEAKSAVSSPLRQCA
jgi:hypothetical protein